LLNIGVRPPLHHVGDERLVAELAADRDHLVFRFRRFDEQHVRPASAYARARRIASDRPFDVRASVRAMMRKSGLVGAEPL